MGEGPRRQLHRQQPGFQALAGVGSVAELFPGTTLHG